MRRIAPALSILVLALSACAGAGRFGGPPGASGPPPSNDGGDRGSGPVEHPAGSEPILVVDVAGGFVPADYRLRQLPSFVMLGDGRVIMVGAQTLEYPGQALPPLLERTLTEEGIQAVLAAVEETGLFDADREMRGAMNVVADAPDTIYRLNAGGRDVTVTIYGLGTIDPVMDTPPGMSAEELEAHRTLTDLNERLFMLDSWLPGSAWSTSEWTAYEPDALRVYVRDVTDEPIEESGGIAPDTRPWPMPGTDPSSFGTALADPMHEGTRCGVVTGEEAATWLTALQEATQITRWESGGRSFSVAPRPLLPHEPTECTTATGS